MIELFVVFILLGFSVSVLIGSALKQNHGDSDRMDHYYPKFKNQKK